MANPPDQAVSLADRIDAVLPQTQCTRCGYPDCRTYAEAVTSGAAEINQCPPGGSEGIQRLAAITGRCLLPLNPVHGAESPMTVALIDEKWCIGCTLCIKVCPTDAIVGSNKRMHTVIPAYCTGCDLCLPVCPVDCITMVNVSGERSAWAAWSPEQAEQAKQRYTNRVQRRHREAAQRQEKHIAQAEHKLEHLSAVSKHTDTQVLDRKRSLIEAALAKARAARASST